LGRVAENAPEEFIRVVRHRDACDAEHRDRAEEEQRGWRREPLEALRGACAQKADAHPEERRNEDEVLIESEYADVRGCISNERELEEENEPGVTGEAKRRAVPGGRCCLDKRRRDGPGARRRRGDGNRGGRHTRETTALRRPSPPRRLSCA